MARYVRQDLPTNSLSSKMPFKRFPRPLGTVHRQLISSLEYLRSEVRQVLLGSSICAPGRVSSHLQLLSLPILPLPVWRIPLPLPPPRSSFIHVLFASRLLPSLYDGVFAANRQKGVLRRNNRSS